MERLGMPGAVLASYGIRRAFGVDTLDALSSAEVGALLSDVEALAEADGLSMHGAALELKRRIGGLDALRGYAASLVAESNRMRGQS